MWNAFLWGKESRRKAFSSESGIGGKILSKFSSERRWVGIFIVAFQKDMINRK